MTVNNSQLRVVDQKNVPYELENEPFWKENHLPNLHFPAPY